MEETREKCPAPGWGAGGVECAGMRGVDSTPVPGTRTAPAHTHSSSEDASLCCMPFPTFLPQHFVHLTRVPSTLYLSTALCSSALHLSLHLSPFGTTPPPPPSAPLPAPPHHHDPTAKHRRASPCRASSPRTRRSGTRRRRDSRTCRRRSESERNGSGTADTTPPTSPRPIRMAKATRASLRGVISLCSRLCMARLCRAFGHSQAQQCHPGCVRRVPHMDVSYGLHDGSPISS